MFKYEPYLCHGCHDLMQKAINFNDVAIASIKGSDYRIHFWYKKKRTYGENMEEIGIKKCLK